ncbi:hypothetical protein RI054_10g54510 [Pseudoscourfieldia marina]
MLIGIMSFYGALLHVHGRLLKKTSGVMFQKATLSSVSVSSWMTSTTHVPRTWMTSAVAIDAPSSTTPFHHFRRQFA